MWDQCCLKHFPPIEREPSATSIPLVETSNQLKRGSTKKLNDSFNNRQFVVAAQKSFEEDK
jgi:hypothetical protein